ncbi:MAG: OpgC domain-containing protein [Xanthobacteraceae bacterium]|nr:OpgC domain-containing protein [Xanthobacteraceae bacterium]
MSTQAGRFKPVEIPRDYRLDLYRGLALWLIFIGHVPGTLLNQIAPWNYGFSDPAEIFIFVSGYANAYVYGRVMENRGVVVAGAQIWRRAFETYVAQMFLFVVFIGEVAWLSHGSHAFDDAMNIRWLHEQPEESILAVMQLKFMPVNMDVLPLYIVVLAASPVILWLLRKSPVLGLALSAAVYAAANLLGLNFPSFPQGSWYFNPLAWQLLFVLGAWCGLGAANWVWSLVRLPAVVIVAAIYVVGVFAVFIGWERLNLAAWFPDWTTLAFGKTNLGVLRMAHFLAIAIVVNRLIPRDWPGLNWRILRPLIQCGQHSLEIFCLGVTLAFAGHVAVVGTPGNVAVRVLVTVAGIAVMIAISALMDWYNSTRVSFRIVTADAAPQASAAPGAGQGAARLHDQPAGAA